MSRFKSFRGFGVSRAAALRVLAACFVLVCAAMSVPNAAIASESDTWGIVNSDAVFYDAVLADETGDKDRAADLFRQYTDYRIQAWTEVRPPKDAPEQERAGPFVSSNVLMTVEKALPILAERWGAENTREFLNRFLPVLRGKDESQRRVYSQKELYFVILAEADALGWKALVEAELDARPPSEYFAQRLVNFPNWAAAAEVSHDYDRGSETEQLMMQGLNLLDLIFERELDYLSRNDDLPFFFGDSLLSDLGILTDTIVQYGTPEHRSRVLSLHRPFLSGSERPEEQMIAAAFVVKLGQKYPDLAALLSSDLFGCASANSQACLLEKVATLADEVSKAGTQIRALTTEGDRAAVLALLPEYLAQGGDSEAASTWFDILREQYGSADINAERTRFEYVLYLDLCTSESHDVIAAIEDQCLSALAKARKASLAHINANPADRFMRIAGLHIFANGGRDIVFTRKADAAKLPSVTGELKEGIAGFLSAHWQKRTPRDEVSVGAPGELACFSVVHGNASDGLWVLDLVGEVSAGFEQPNALAHMEAVSSARLAECAILSDKRELAAKMLARTEDAMSRLNVQIEQHRNVGETLKASLPILRHDLDHAALRNLPHPDR